MNVSTKVGQIFFRILDETIPPGHPLRPLLNRNTVKLSYSCLPNFGSEIAKHNAKILNSAPNLEDAIPPKKCNCQKQAECPLENNCTEALNVIYHAAVTSEGQT